MRTIFSDDSPNTACERPELGSNVVAESEVSCSALAPMVSDQRRRSCSAIVRLKKGGSGTPLFMIHGLGGTFLELSRLASLICCKGSVYGFRAKGHDGSERPLRTVEEMAEYYVAAIRDIQPEGPYFLVGYSFGGVVAVEIARRLRNDENGIALLALIESYARRETWPLRARFDAWCCRMQHRGIKFASQPLRDTLALITVKSKSLAVNNVKFLDRFFSNLSEQHSSFQSETGLCRDEQLVFEAEKAAKETYTPHYYGGKIVFLKPEITNFGFPPDPSRIWRALAEKFEIRCVAGDHQTMITQHAASVASCLSTYLANAPSSV